MDNFNLKSYLKQNPLLENIPKGEWTHLDNDETQENADEILALIKNAYKEIGGHVNYKNTSDITNDDEFEVIDFDVDDELDAVYISSIKPAGMKMVGIGHDGEKRSKRELIRRKVELLNKPGYYVEVSGRIKDILLAKGVPIVDDETTIRKIMASKEIKMNDDGTYTRVIGGRKFTKILLGKPLIKE